MSRRRDAPRRHRAPLPALRRGDDGASRSGACTAAPPSATRVVAAPGWRTPIALAGLLLASRPSRCRSRSSSSPTTPTQVAQPPRRRPPTPAARPTPAPTPTPDRSTPDPAADRHADGDAERDARPPTATPDAQRPARSRVARGRVGLDGHPRLRELRGRRRATRRRASPPTASPASGSSTRTTSPRSSAGYWVVYSGAVRHAGRGEDALEGIDAPDAYVRQITPD